MNKNYAAVSISAEVLFMEMSWRDPRYVRKANRTSTPPTAEAWERYRAAKAGMAALEAYEGTEWGGPDCRTEVHKPEPTVEFDYLETHDEWMARCRSIMSSPA